MLHKDLNNTIWELYNQAYMYVKQLHRSEPTFFFGDKMLMNCVFIKRRNRKRPDIPDFYILFSPEI